MPGRVIAVTGAFGVLGSAVVAEANQRGWRVAAIDLAAAPPEGWAGSGAALVLGGVDLTGAVMASTAMDEVVGQLGGLDALANIAGGFRWQTLEDGDPAVWDQLFALNFKTAAHACRAALPHLRASGAGRIVNVGALGAVKAAAGMGAYAAGKSAVHRLTESLAEELKDTAVTVNAVLPSIIDTETNRADMPKADFSRWVAAPDLAQAILFLASEEARAITGALIPVAGRM